MKDDQWKQLRTSALEHSGADIAAASEDIDLTRRQILQVLDESAVDAGKLNDFIRIVTDAKTSNADKARQIRNIDGLAEIAVSLAGRVLAG